MQRRTGLEDGFVSLSDGVSLAQIGLYVKEFRIHPTWSDFHLCGRLIRGCSTRLSRNNYNAGLS